MAWALLSAIREMDAHKGPFMPQASADLVCDRGELFLMSYQALHEGALTQNRAAYKLRPKLHYAWHMFDTLRRTRENPRRQDLFDSEDFIGKLKRIASKTHRRTAPLRTVQRMIVFLSHRWHTRR